jgi:hypothetical protein
MTEIEKIRSLLWDAYKKAYNCGELEGSKSADGSCSLHYPSFFECDTKEEFLKPNMLEVYSYSLGPSRRHYFRHSGKDEQINYYTWDAPDLFKKANEIIGVWKSLIQEAETGIK